MKIKHKFIFVGDLVLNSKPCFSPPINDLFRDAAIVSGNVEAPLRGAGHPIDKIGPLVDQDHNAAEWLINLGFNLFSMANNHIYDYDKIGLEETKRAFSQFPVIGVGDEDEAYGLKVESIDGIRYGFVSYGENGFGALNGDKNVGYAWVNNDRVNNDLQVYKKLVDFLIVQVHAGVELLDVPIPEWRARYYEIIDNGADIIIGHHPHVVQTVELYKGKPIFYSLGNFYFDYPSKYSKWNVGGIASLEFLNGSLDKFDLILVEKKGSEVHLLDLEDSARIKNDLEEKLFSTDYEEYVNNQAVRFWKKYHQNYYGKPVNGLVNYSIKSVLKHIKRVFFNRNINYNFIWHNLFIESNIWIVKRAIAILKKKDSQS